MTKLPAGGMKISVDVKESYSITMADLSGRVLWRGQGSGDRQSEFAIAKNRVPPGLKVIKVRTPNETLTKKILVY